MTNRSERHRKLRLYFTEKLGGRCSECRTEKNLRFHHVDPSTKSFNLGEAFGWKSFTQLEEEVAKCILLCAACHKQHHSPINHGHVSYKTEKCRCDICHQAYLKYWEDYRRKRGQPIKAVAEHGTHSKYNMGCHCDKCRIAEYNYRYNLRLRKFNDEKEI